jgi:hypothetical protein
MKNIFIILLVIFMANPMFAQDLIVTNEHDSIHCKITKVKADYIYFTFKHKDEIRSTLLPLSNVITHQYDFYPASEVLNEVVMKNDNYQHVRIALNGGFSYHTARVAGSVPDDFRDYVNQLKSGLHFGGDLTYYFTEPLGLGMKYLLYKTSNSLDGIYLEDEYGNRRYGIMSDDLTISFLGPTFSTRLFSHDKKGAFLLNTSIGYMGYSNNKVIVDNYKMTGSTLGLAFDFGYDVGLTDNLSLGFQLSYISGTLFEYDWNDGVTTETIKLDINSYESLNRIDVSIGLRLTL